MFLVKAATDLVLLKETSTRNHATKPASNIAFVSRAILGCLKSSFVLSKRIEKDDPLDKPMRGYKDNEHHDGLTEDDGSNFTEDSPDDES